MFPPPIEIITTGLGIAGYIIVGAAVITVLARWLLGDVEGEFGEVDTRPSDWLLFAAFVAAWPLVLVIVGILSLAAFILRGRCLD